MLIDLFNAIADMHDVFQDKVLALGIKIATALASSQYGYAYFGFFLGIFVFKFVLEWWESGDFLSFFLGLTRMILLIIISMMVLGNWGKFQEVGVNVQKSLEGIVLEGKPVDTLVASAKKFSDAIWKDVGMDKNLFNADAGSDGNSTNSTNWVEFLGSIF